MLMIKIEWYNKTGALVETRIEQLTEQFLASFLRDRGVRPVNATEIRALKERILRPGGSRFYYEDGHFHIERIERRRTPRDDADNGTRDAEAVT